ncbi:MAG TPA: hypothetical protein VHI31_08065, partial [Actinomycetota bacterium]|nr:hypothetical protein [Actinomycetota bacterium]
MPVVIVVPGKQAVRQPDSVQLLHRFSLYSDPVEPGFEVSPFVVTTSSSSYSSVFDNGLDAGRIDWITRGVLT